MPSPSLSDLGLTPDEEETARERRRQRRHEEYADESGLRPLPREAVQFEGAGDEVVLPGVRSRATLFGIGAGIGFAVLAVTAGLYFGGYLDRSTLNPSPEPAPLVQNTTLDDAMRAQALEIARFANVKLLSPPVVTPVIRELPDMLVIDGDVPSPNPSLTNPMPAMPEPEGMSTPPRSTTPRDRAPTLKDPEMPPPPSGTPPDREPLPAPARPTAPAETAPGPNPY